MDSGLRRNDPVGWKGTFRPDIAPPPTLHILAPVAANL